MIEAVLTAIAANTIVLSIVAFLCKSIINHFLSKDIATFQSRIEYSAKAEIESFRSSLEKERIRLQIAYGGIFEKQANSIIEIYKLVVIFEKAISSVITPLDDQENYFKEFNKSYNELFDYYELNRVLLPSDIEENFELLRKDMLKAVITHKRVEEQLKRPNLLSEKDFERLFARQDKAYELFDKLPSLKKDLTDKLRYLIGIHQK